MVNAHLFCFETSSTSLPPLPLVCLPMICRREEQRMLPLSVDAHVQCHCQIVRSCPTPHCLGPATALETHTHAFTHMHRHSIVASSSRTAAVKTCIFHYIIIRNAGCGLRTSVKQLHVEFFFFFLPRCDITVNTAD